MTLGGNKKVYWLIPLGLLAAYSVYTNLLSGPDIPVSSTPRTAAADGAASSPSIPVPTTRNPAPRASSRGRSEEFHPIYLPKRLEDRRDPTSIDPTLQMEKLAKVQEVSLVGGSRNLFQFGPPPGKALAGTETKVVPVAFVGPRLPVPPAAALKPPAPPPEPIKLKFYGLSTAKADGKKMGFFMDGDDILIAGEGDTLKRRYRILKIGPTAVTVEDLDAKRQQNVPITEEAPSAP